MFRYDGVLRGMAAGLVAAGVMSTLRPLAHRAGMIDRMVPQILQERAAGAAGVDVPGGSAGHQLAAEAIHHGVSLAAGGVLGAVSARPGFVTGVAYGLAIWAVDALGVLPALRVQRVGGRTVDLVAHGLFGATVAFAMRELGAQPPLEAEPSVIPLRRRVG